MTINIPHLISAPAVGTPAKDIPRRVRVDSRTDDSRSAQQVQTRYLLIIIAADNGL